MAKPEVTEVRHPIDLDKFTQYLNKLTKDNFPSGSTIGVKLPNFSQSKFTIEQFAFGQSNPTYLLTDKDGERYVLRRKPSPNGKLVSKSAHAIEREFFLLKLIGHHNEHSSRRVPIPDTYVLCEDELIIGYVFYVMQYIDGDQIKNPALPGIPEEDHSTIWQSVMDTSTAIHLLDVEKLIVYLPKQHFPQFHSLEKLKGTSYFSRQVKSLRKVAELQLKHVEPIPDFEYLCDWMLERSPKDPPKLTLIHGDFKIDNMLFDPKTKKVKAVLDWELCTVGHPLFDLGNYLQPFQMPNAFTKALYKDRSNIGQENPELIASLKAGLIQYQKSYGASLWDPKDPKNNPIDLWIVGYVFGLLRLCVISQGIAMRSKSGNASSAQAAQMGNLYPILAGLALRAIKDDKAKL